MENLWQTVWRRWLDARSRRGVDHLCDHLRRDIGLDDVEPPPSPGGTGQPFRTRILSDGRTVTLLHECR